MSRQIHAAATCRWRVGILALVCTCLSLASLAWAVPGAAQARPSEDQVKAAYLLNFGKFVRSANGGPVSKGPTFDICIVGHEDAITQTLGQIVGGESVDNRPVRVQHLSDPSQAKNCAIVFLSNTENPSLREDLAVLAGSDALTVSDAPDFLEHGGMIQFVLQGDHVRFEVNLDAVNRTHLVLSSELLRVAAVVKGRPAPGGAR